MLVLGSMRKSHVRKPSHLMVALDLHESEDQNINKNKLIVNLCTFWQAERFHSDLVWFRDETATKLAAFTARFCSLRVDFFFAVLQLQLCNIQVHPPPAKCCSLMLRKERRREGFGVLYLEYEEYVQEQRMRLATIYTIYTFIHWLARNASFRCSTVPRRMLLHRNCLLKSGINHKNLHSLLKLSAAISSLPTLFSNTCLI